MNNELTNSNESEIRYDSTEFSSETVTYDQPEVNNNETTDEELIEDAKLNSRQKKVINVLGQLKNLHCLL